MEITNYRKLENGTMLYVVVPARTTHNDCMARDLIVINDESDDLCACYGVYLKTTGGQQVSDIGGDAKIFDNAEERDLAVAELNASARAGRAEYNSGTARAARDAKLDARDKAIEEAAIRREIDKMNKVLG